MDKDLYAEVENAIQYVWMKGRMSPGNYFKIVSDLRRHRRVYVIQNWAAMVLTILATVEAVVILAIVS